jgi:hypothetical protein
MSPNHTATDEPDNTKAATKGARIPYLTPVEVFCRLAAILPMHELLVEPEQLIDPSSVERCP